MVCADSRTTDGRDGTWTEDEACREEKIAAESEERTNESLLHETFFAVAAAAAFMSIVIRSINNETEKQLTTKTETKKITHNLCDTSHELKRF